MASQGFWLFADGSLGPTVFVLVKENQSDVLLSFKEDNFRAASSKTPEAFSKVSQYFKEKDLDLSELSLVLGFGPGSLTSIKVFLTSALTFSKIHKLDFFKCNSLLIWSYLFQKEAQSHEILSYAGRSEYFVYDHRRTYLIKETELNKLSSPVLIESSKMKARDVKVEKFNPDNIDFSSFDPKYLLNHCEKSHFGDLRINYFKGFDQLY